MDTTEETKVPAEETAAPVVAPEAPTTEEKTEEAPAA